MSSWPAPSALDPGTQTFPVLTTAQIARIAAYGRMRPIQRSEILVEQGDRCVRFFVVTAGKLEIVTSLGGDCNAYQCPWSWSVHWGGQHDLRPSGARAIACHPAGRGDRAGSHEFSKHASEMAREGWVRPAGTGRWESVNLGLA